MSGLPVVTFLPGKKKIQVRAGENLLDAALSAGVYIDSRCGGEGTCGKCRLIVKSGDVKQDEAAMEHLTDDDRKAGVVLACLSEPRGDVTVEVPPSALLDEEAILTDEVEEKAAAVCIPEEYTGGSLTEKVHLVLTPPSITDNTSDLRRLLRELKHKNSGITRPPLPLDLLRRISDVLRQSNWDITVTTCCLEENPQIIDIEQGDRSKRNFGIAVDIGTTTIAIDLVNLNTLKVCASRGAYNAQIAYGEDVITRIFHSTKKNGLQTLQKVALDTINGLIYHLAVTCGIKTDEITAAAIAANSTMTHLFLGMTPVTIRREPWIPTVTYLPIFKAGELGMKCAQNAPVFFSPLVTGYMGGDITAGIIASGLHKAEKVSLFIDMGTNGEIVLGNKEWLVSCSCSSGPAFEGVGIECGMRAASGAVERVEVDLEKDRVALHTTGGGKPRGICGTGLISTMAALLEAGVLNRSGSFDRSMQTPRMREGREGPEFVLSTRREAAGDREIYITEADIKNLIRSKAAIYAGCQVLLKKVGYSFDDIEYFYIAGGFGSHLDIEQAVYIGLLPDIPRERFRFIGNTSLAGALMLLLSEKARREVMEIAEKMTYIELSVDNDFMEEFTAAMFLPHTNLEMFPSVTNNHIVVRDS
ncbi:MAG: ASKHA domain-containing protein [bacterium]